MEPENQDNQPGMGGVATQAPPKPEPEQPLEEPVAPSPDPVQPVATPPIQSPVPAASPKSTQNKRIILIILVVLIIVVAIFLLK